MAESQKTKEHFVLYTDGASSGNPGHSGIAFLIYNETGDIIAKEARYIGKTTNNVAEYTAVICALQKAIDLDIKSVEIRLDSELIVKQLNNEYQVRSNRLKPLYHKVRNLLNKFSTFSLVKISREKNRPADKLASSAVKRYLSETDKEKQKVFDEPKQVERPKKKRKSSRKWV